NAWFGIRPKPTITMSCGGAGGTNSVASISFVSSLWPGTTFYYLDLAPTSGFSNTSDVTTSQNWPAGTFWNANIGNPTSPYPILTTTLNRYGTATSPDNNVSATLSGSLTAGTQYVARLWNGNGHSAISMVSPPAKNCAAYRPFLQTQRGNMYSTGSI